MKFILLLLLFITALFCEAQENQSLRLFSDRDIYTSGETLLAKVFSSTQEVSGVVHIGLLNLNGRIIAEVNKKLSDHQADGYLYLTDSLKTGTYLLCAYTKTKPEYAFREIFISNRFNGLSDNVSQQSATGIIEAEEMKANINLTGLGSKYNTRSMAEVKVQIPAELLARFNNNLLISVAEVIPGHQSKSYNKTGTAFFDQKSETEGVILQGSLKDLDNGIPFNNGCVFLSIPDSIPMLKYFITGEDGRFSFQLDNYYGKIPVVLQGYDINKKRLVKVVPDRTDSISNLPEFTAQPASEELRKVVRNYMDATTLRKIFSVKEVEAPAPATHPNDYPFYGVPTETIRPALFIDLPDFTEISRELLPGVKFRAYNRIPTMQIFNPVNQKYFNEPPLVLLNGVPVQDLNQIKNISSRDVDRIEVCRRERYYGDLGFCGIVAIFTTKQFSRLLKESDELIKLNLDALQPDATLSTPKNILPNEPDLRKVLYWKPNVKPAETINVDFITSDIRGLFKLVVVGKTREGSLLRQEQIFEVN